MVIDRIIAGTIFVLGIVQIALMYAAPDMAPLSMTAPTLVLVAIMVAAYIIETTTIFFRRTRPVSMLWICIIAEAVTMGTAIMQGLHNSNTNNLAIPFLSYAVIRYAPKPVPHLIAQTCVYTLMLTLVWTCFNTTPSSLLVRGGIGVLSGLASFALGVGIGYIVSNNQRLVAAQRQTLLAEERTRIARELHDTTAHHLSSIAIQTTAARAILHSNPTAVEKQLEGISTSISQALADVRATVNTLRTPTEAEATHTPQPTIARIPDLITECRNLGMSIRVTGPGLRTDLTAPEQQCAYRTIQEALTNARKHASGAPVTINLDEAGLMVTTHGIFTPGEPRRIVPGRGSVGMQERANHCGATLINEPDSDGWKVALTWKT